DVLRADILEHLGRDGSSRALVTALLKRKELSAADRSICELVLGKLDWKGGDNDGAILHLQRAVSSAKGSGDLHRLCRCQLRLLQILSDRSGSNASAPLLAELRANTTKLGDPTITAGVHIVMGEIDAKLGLIRSSHRHIKAAANIVATDQNLWQEAQVANSQLNLSVLKSDFDAAIFHGKRALALARQSGALYMEQACLTNVAHVLYLLGQFDDAIDHFAKAFEVRPSTIQPTHAGYDGLAQLYLTLGRLDECNALLERINEHVRLSSDRRLYTYRYAELTFVRLLIRRGQWIEAREESRMLHRLAIESGDRLLECLVDLARADLCALSGETDSLLAIVGLGSHRFVGHLELFAEYERVVATGSRAAGCSAANSHFQRAKRIFAGLRNVPGLLEVKRCLSSETTNGCDQPADDATDFDPMAVVQQVASLMLLDGRPQLLASELIHLLHQTACVDWAVAVARADTGDYERLAACGAVPPELPAEPS